ncbi:MAG: hypothetical protein IKT26_06975 [Bacteroidaceae bacterium]|nr:hypothetical protein [Bacteroidaceae bacterium]
MNANIPSPAVKHEETGMFSHVSTGERRVSQVEVLDKQSGEWRAVENARQYTVATLDYLILKQGGSGILSCVQPDSTYYGAEIEILRHYLETNLGGTIGTEYAEPQGRIIYQ